MIDTEHVKCDTCTAPEPMEDAARSATDERTRAAVVRLGNNLIDNFEEELA